MRIRITAVAIAFLASPRLRQHRDRNSTDMALAQLSRARGVLRTHLTA
jgi:hypothetical protein